MFAVMINRRDVKMQRSSFDNMETHFDCNRA